MHGMAHTLLMNLVPADVEAYLRVKAPSFAKFNAWSPAVRSFGGSRVLGTCRTTQSAALIFIIVSYSARA